MGAEKKNFKSIEMTKLVDKDVTEHRWHLFLLDLLCTEEKALLQRFKKTFGGD